MAPSDPPGVRLLRPKVLEAAGALGLTSIVDQAVDLVKGGQSIHPEVETAAYGLAVSSGRKEVYAAVKRLYEEVGLWVCVVWDKAAGCSVWAVGSGARVWSEG